MAELIYRVTDSGDQRVTDTGDLRYAGLLASPVTAPTITIGTEPDATIAGEFASSIVRVVRWLDIYESDATTLWREKVGVTSGSVSVDMDRDDRRNFDVTISDTDGSLGYGPDNKFWYDKILRPYRGVEFINGDQWVAPLGVFVPDSFSRPRFPSTIQVTCRDLTKKLLQDKFPDTTTFTAGTNVGTVISAIAANGGITNQVFATTSETLDEDITFERGSPRFDGMKDLAVSIGHELYFDVLGALVMRPYVDPTTAPVSFTFLDGSSGNLVDWSRSTNDSRLFNDVIVYGSGTKNALVFGRAQNTDAGSPTRIAQIGRRMAPPFPNQFVKNNTRANAIADAFLAVSGLEQFDMNFQSIMFPWLTVGDAVEIQTSDAEPSDPTRFLLAQITIPMDLAPMSGVGRRVTIVG